MHSHLQFNAPKLFIAAMNMQQNQQQQQQNVTSNKEQQQQQPLRDEHLSKKSSNNLKSCHCKVLFTLEYILLLPFFGT